jgi:hypothetical protein
MNEYKFLYGVILFLLLSDTGFREVVRERTQAVMSALTGEQ